MFRKMYVLFRDGVKVKYNLQDEIQLYYININSLQIFSSNPKLKDASKALENENINYINISECSTYQTKSAIGTCKSQLKQIRGSALLSTSFIEESPVQSITGGTLTAVFKVLTGSVMEKAKISREDSPG